MSDFIIDNNNDYWSVYDDNDDDYYNYVDNDNNDSELKYSSSEKFMEIFNFINKLIKQDPEISASNVYNKLVTEGLIDLDSNELEINFGEAQMLDNHFFPQTGGFYWLDAYSRPKSDEIFKFNNEYFQAFDCGIFTFTYKPVKNYFILNNIEDSNNIEKIFIQDDRDDGYNMYDLSNLSCEELNHRCFTISKFIQSEHNNRLNQDNGSKHDDSSKHDDRSGLDDESEQDDVFKYYNGSDNQDIQSNNSDYDYDHFDEQETIEETKKILVESKILADKIFEFVQTCLIGEPEIKPWEMAEIIKNHFPELEKSRSLCFIDAYELDKKIFSKGGEFWRTAYNYPKELDIVKINGINYNANKVGIFTFSTC
jgi:hypothetical protein